MENEKKHEGLEGIKLSIDVYTDDDGKYYIKAEDFFDFAEEAIIKNEKIRVELRNLIKKILL